MSEPEKPEETKESFNPFGGAALKLQDGCIYVLECDYILSADHRASIQADLDGVLKDRNIRMLILDRGKRIVRTGLADDAEPRPEPSVATPQRKLSHFSQL